MQISPATHEAAHSDLRLSYALEEVSQKETFVLRSFLRTAFNTQRMNFCWELTERKVDADAIVIGQTMGSSLHYRHHLSHIGKGKVILTLGHEPIGEDIQIPLPLQMSTLSACFNEAGVAAQALRSRDQTMVDQTHAQAIEGGAFIANSLVALRPPSELFADGVRYSLRRWPSTDVLKLDGSYVRASAILCDTPRTLTSLVGCGGLTLEDWKCYLKVTHAHGFLSIDAPNQGFAPQPSLDAWGLDVAAPSPPSAARQVPSQASLFARIRAKLRI